MDDTALITVNRKSTLGWVKGKNTGQCTERDLILQKTAFVYDSLNKIKILKISYKLYNFFISHGI